MTTPNPILRVTAAEYVCDYKLRLTFSTGEVKIVDFTSLMQKGICVKLQDLDYFKSFSLDPFTVDWNDEIAFDPLSLYERGIKAYDYEDEKFPQSVAEEFVKGNK